MFSRRWTKNRWQGWTCSMKSPDQLSVPPDGRAYHEQPQWRNDFPIDWPQDELVARRDFTKFLVLTSFAFAVGQVWIVAENIFGIFSVVAMLVVLQLWLLTATMNAYLAGQERVIVPAALASIVCLALNLG